MITLFHRVMLLVHDWAVCSTQIGYGMGYWWTNTSEVGGLNTIYPSCDVICIFRRDEWQIKGLVAVIMAGGYDVTRFPPCASKRATSVGVVPPGIMPILVIGLLGCGGRLLGRSDWLYRSSGQAWLADGPGCVRSAVVFFLGGVRIVYIRSEPAGSSSIDAMPVTGSLLFYASVCCFAICGATELSLSVLFGGTACIWLAGWELFFRQVCVSSVMAADSVAAAGGRAGITFGVELVIPWDAPEAVINLNSDGLLDLDMVPDVIGLSGRRPDTAVCRILQGRDVKSVRALVPDTRSLERNCHDVTIVDMGELPEVSVSIADWSRLREQWPPTVLRHMVWLQQDLDTMCAEARRCFRNTRPGRCSYCDKMIKCDMSRHVSTYHLDLAQLWRCPVSWCTVWKGTPQDCMDHVGGT